MLNPINLVDYFLQFSFSKELLISFGVLGISLLVQFVIFGGFDDI